MVRRNWKQLVLPGLRRCGLAQVVGALLLVTASACQAETTAPKPVERVVPFDQVGVVVVKHSFFDTVRLSPEDEKKYVAPAEVLADRLLVTVKGVYNFLETPDNKRLVGGLEPGTVITARGKLYAAGDLLVLASIEKAEAGVKVDTSKFSSAKGAAATLEGTNRCQCSLDLAGLPHSCTLGHLHHLQTADGTLYHYLPLGTGPNLHAGRGSHGAKVKLDAMVLPGNNLQVLPPAAKK